MFRGLSDLFFILYRGLGGSVVCWENFDGLGEDGERKVYRRGRFDIMGMIGIDRRSLSSH